MVPLTQFALILQENLTAEDVSLKSSGLYNRKTKQNKKSGCFFFQSSWNPIQTLKRNLMQHLIFFFSAGDITSWRQQSGLLRRVVTFKNEDSMQISILLINVSLYTTKCKGCKVGSSFKWNSLAKISQAKTYHRTFLFRVRSAFAPFCGLFLPTAFKSMVICPCLRLKAIVSEHRVLPVCCLSQCSSFKKFLGQAYYILLLKKSAFSGSLEPSAFFTFFAKF